MTSHQLVLTGLDGSNPLAFLAALGTLRALRTADPTFACRLGWRRDRSWQPVIETSIPLSASELLDRLSHELKGKQRLPEFNALGDDLTVTAEVFRQFAADAGQTACHNDRRTADFAAAFGCDATVTDTGVIQDTALRTMAGAGHQHLLGFMRNIVEATQSEHLENALFHPWRYKDPLQNLSLRWDPADDIRYALQWRNPSGDPSRKSGGSMLGANRLAIEGLPLVVTAPVGVRLETTGFRGKRSSDTFWTWPIWEPMLSMDSVRSVLALKDLRDFTPNREKLLRIGVTEVFRSQRLTIGKVRNFTPAQSV